MLLQVLALQLLILTVKVQGRESEDIPDSELDGKCEVLEDIRNSLKALLQQSHAQQQDVIEIKDDVGSLKFGFSQLQEVTTELTADSKRQQYKLHKLQASIDKQDEKIDDLGESLTDHETETTERINSLESDVEAHNHPCGPDNDWVKVVDFDMKDPSTTCPDGWARSMFSLPTCGRATHEDDHVCYPASFKFPQGELSFSKVCGRVKGYAYGGVDGFENAKKGNEYIHQAYVTGVSLTAGNPMQHIWTFAASLAELGRFSLDPGDFFPEVCPCDTRKFFKVYVPKFVGNNYFCEAPTLVFTEEYFFEASDPLWDGKNCALPSSCCYFNHPPYFINDMGYTLTVDAIDARICLLDEGPVNEGDPGDDVLVEVVEIYVAP